MGNARRGTRNRRAPSFFLFLFVSFLDETEHSAYTARPSVGGVMAKSSIRVIAFLSLVLVLLGNAAVSRADVTGS